MIYVLDASVLLKWFVEEPDTPAALTYRTRFREGDVTLACPDLALYEVANVLRQKRGVPEEALTHALTDLLSLELDIFTPTETLLRHAVHISYAKHLTVYDASYVALAHELQATLVSADRELCRQAHGVVPVEPLSPTR